jgi:hypothetical protein
MPASITELRPAHLNAVTTHENVSILRRIAIPVTRNSQVQTHRHAAMCALQSVARCGRAGLPVLAGGWWR